MKKLFLKIFRRFLIWLTKSEFWYTLLMKVIPYLRFTTYYTNFRGWKYHRGYQLLQPGDFVCSLDDKKLTTFLIPGEFAHASFCVSKDGEFEMAEMTHHDFTRSTFFDICAESTRVCIFRSTDYDPEYIEKMVEKCKSFKDTEYDVEFKLGVDLLACSELVYFTDFEKRLQVNLEDIHLLGRDYISPDGLTKGKTVIKVWDSDNEKI